MTKTKRLLLPLLVLGSLLVAAPAQGAYIVGVGDQDPALFENKLWQDLKLKRVRYIVPYNTARDSVQRAQVAQYMAAARAKRQEVLVHFSGVRGCFNNGRYSRSSKCRAPSVARYTSDFRAFRKLYPSVKTYGTWNEANSPSQPIAKNPKRAAQYYTALKRYCSGCKVIAGDLLDSSNLRSYASAMNRELKGRARLWGLHNYGDVNRNRSTGTQTMLRTVPGEVWVTETGGIVKFSGSNLRPTETKAVRGIRNMFALAARYDSRPRGYKARVSRVYQYNFREQPDARFDAALLDPDGSPRKTYASFKSGLRKRDVRR